MGAGSQYQKASPPHDSSAAFMRMDRCSRCRQISAPAATCTSCSQTSHPRKIGTVIGAMPEIDSSV